MCESGCFVVDVVDDLNREESWYVASDCWLKMVSMSLLFGLAHGISFSKQSIHDDDGDDLDVRWWDLLIEFFVVMKIISDPKDLFF